MGFVTYNGITSTFNTATKTHGILCHGWTRSILNGDFEMTTTTLTLRPATAIVSKTGKISTIAERAERAVNGASTGVRMALALHGKSSTTRKTSATSFDVVTLESLLALDVLDGSQWPDVYAHLADQFGYKVEGGRGKTACKALLAYAQTGINGQKIIASCDGMTDAAYKRMTAQQTLIDTCIDAIQRWEQVAQQAAQQAAELTTN